ncbi:hypothetical protein RvY_08415 [Ramazzottius varieornatus]|uniref:Uncharacterized protein n=1 Tax=Ramazzottius varieornatus TaxID=947166 RepID=A0A1D1V5Q0_RAMVA|nr:hypothetical protein RvY_08415 [Ramazzottius varieornatus]
MTHFATFVKHYSSLTRRLDRRRTSDLHGSCETRGADVAAWTAEALFKTHETMNLIETGSCSNDQLCRVHLELAADLVNCRRQRGSEPSGK